MTTFYAAPGAEYAAWLASTVEGPHAGNTAAVIDDLGDGRVSFGRNTLDILRALPPDFDGSVSEDEDGALVLWMCGQPFPVTGTMEPNEETGR